MGWDGIVPTIKERRHVWRCILIKEVLFVSETELWNQHPIAYRALVTLRYCMDAIQRLIDGGHAVTPSFIKAVVMQTDGLDGDVLFCLDEMAEYLIEDQEARSWWQAQVGDERFPHRCPQCGSAAYVGFRLVECKARCRDS